MTVTTPAHSPEPAKRSKRLYILWGVALTLLLAAGAFCWLVVVPVSQMRAHLSGLAARTSQGKALDYFGYKADLDRTVNDLGGRAVASERIARYLKYPAWIAPHREEAYHVLMECGESGEAVLRELIKHGRPGERRYAADTLKTMRGLKESQR
jgi:hypothetical protein